MPARFHWRDATIRDYIVRMDNIQTAVCGMGCFWGAERLFWSLNGVLETAVGYAGGVTTNPSYKEVCSGTTHHAEVVLVKFDPAVISYSESVHYSHLPLPTNRKVELPVVSFSLYK